MLNPAQLVPGEVDYGRRKTEEVPCLVLYTDCTVWYLSMFFPGSSRASILLLLPLHSTTVGSSLCLLAHTPLVSRPRPLTLSLGCIFQRVLLSLTSQWQSPHITHHTSHLTHHQLSTCTCTSTFSPSPSLHSHPSPLSLFLEKSSASSIVSLLSPRLPRLHNSIALSSPPAATKKIIPKIPKCNKPLDWGLSALVA